MNNADKDQSDLLSDFIYFKKGTKPKGIKKKKPKRDIIESLNALFEGREIVLNTLKSR